jgi:hypothetical protein
VLRLKLEAESVAAEYLRLEEEETARQEIMRLEEGALENEIIRLESERYNPPYKRIELLRSTYALEAGFICFT